MAHLSEEIILQGMVLGFTKAAAMSAQAGAGSLVENALLQGMVLGFTKAAAMAVQAGADSLVVEIGRASCRERV